MSPHTGRSAAQGTGRVLPTLTRSDSTVSSMSSYRPRSSPAGLYNYTGSKFYQTFKPIHIRKQINFTERDFKIRKLSHSSHVYKCFITNLV